MTRIVAGIYTDAREAARAAGTVQRAGFAVSTATAEQVAGLSDDERARVLIVADPDDREAELRSLFMKTGATQLQGHGSEGTGTSSTPELSREDPVPVQHGERAGTPATGDSQMRDVRSSDPVAGPDSSDISDADPRYQMIRTAAADPLDKLELEERLRRGPLASGPPR